MINLIDPEQQRQYKAARLNVKLLRFVILSLIVVVGVGTIYGVGFWLAFNDRAIAQSNHQAAEEELVKYAPTVAEASAYRQNLTMAKQILGSEMVFSDFLMALGALMPANTIVDGINLSTTKTTSQTVGGISLTTRAKSYDDVLKIKQAFENSSLFSNVRISNTNVPEKPSTEGNKATYPYEATFEVVINALRGTTK